MNCPSCGQDNQEGTTACPTCGTNLATSANEAVTAEDRRFLSTGFVGRQREMGELTVALEDALSGQGRLVILVGEPGIGKTRTAQELASHAEGLGAQVLWGRCYEEEGAPPYWPWVQSIRSDRILRRTFDQPFFRKHQCANRQERKLCASTE